MDVTSENNKRAIAILLDLRKDFDYVDQNIINRRFLSSIYQERVDRWKKKWEEKSLPLPKIVLESPEQDEPRTMCGLHKHMNSTKHYPQSVIVALRNTQSTTSWQSTSIKSSFQTNDFLH
ncbi:hypothetical protein J6590_061799 [Homalodisca vitripennis]|nr:hypothetical protein J6590_061799 [Homalodisca vitripennis]